jgi:hypothetical protein
MTSLTFHMLLLLVLRPAQRRPHHREDLAGGRLTPCYSLGCGQDGPAGYILAPEPPVTLRGWPGALLVLVQAGLSGTGSRHPLAGLQQLATKPSLNPTHQRTLSLRHSPGGDGKIGRRRELRGLVTPSRDPFHAEQARSTSHQAVAEALHIELALVATPVGGFRHLLAD